MINKVSFITKLYGRSQLFLKLYIEVLGFPGGSAAKESACNTGDPDSIPGSR